MAEADFQKATIAIDYAPISEKVLGETSIIRQVSNKDILGDISKGTQLKVFVHGLSTITDYVTGTGVAPVADGSDYVTLNNQKDKVINELLDGLTVKQAYNNADHIAARLEAAMVAVGEEMDTDGFVKIVADGTEAFAAGADKPDTGALTYTRILSLKTALDNAKAPQSGRSLIMTPEMLNLVLQADSKITLSTDRGDMIQATGWVGQFLGFNIFMTTLLPANTNMVAMQERGFAHTDDFTTGVFLQSLDGSANFVGDSAIKGRFAYNSGSIRATFIQTDQSAA